jgi:hypothetical protein
MHDDPARAERVQSRGLGDRRDENDSPPPVRCVERELGVRRQALREHDQDVVRRRRPAADECRERLDDGVAAKRPEDVREQRRVRGGAADSPWPRCAPHGLHPEAKVRHATRRRPRERFGDRTHPLAEQTTARTGTPARIVRVDERHAPPSREVGLDQWPRNVLIGVREQHHPRPCATMRATAASHPRRKRGARSAKRSSRVTRWTRTSAESPPDPCVSTTRTFPVTPST